LSGGVTLQDAQARGFQTTTDDGASVEADAHESTCDVNYGSDAFVRTPERDDKHDMVASDIKQEDDAVVYISDSSELTEVSTDAGLQRPVASETPLPRQGGLSTAEALDIVCGNHVKYVHNVVPRGTKNNVYFVVDNTIDMERASVSQKHTFFDDGGAWDSSTAGQSRHPYWIVGGERRRLFWMAIHQKYCRDTK
jgi:hypothetical protein